MTTGRIARLLAIAALLLAPAWVEAQEATLTGTVTDSTGAVLPGASVTAVHEASGNQFVGATDERGVYRIPARVGTYRLTIELEGFRAVTRDGVQLLVGQALNLDIPMVLANLQETVIVTREARLLDTVSSSLGGNVDSRQMQELPTQGRNWMSLALLAPGSRTNPTNASGAPLNDRNGGETREFQLNVDGQQVSSELGAGNQPTFSSDSIAEFQFISNRFDATQGRSSGVQVNAVSKSGSNTLSTLFRTNFRDSRFNAQDPVAKRVLPISNQQYSVTVGGPIVRDRLHYFAHFEYERQPMTAQWNTPYPSFNISLEGKGSTRIAGFRADYQLSPRARVMGKMSGQKTFVPFDPPTSRTTHPAQTATTDERNRELLGQYTQVLSNKAVNEVKVGYSHYGFANALLTNWSRHYQAPRVTNGHPRITFTGFSIAGSSNHPRHRDQNVWSVRDDFMYSYDGGGHHDVRVGFEFVRHFEDSENCALCASAIDARGGPVPDNIEALFPDPFNVDTWNLAGISSITRNVTIGVGTFPNQYAQPKYGSWLQDDWRISNALTLNLGLRYDLSLNAWANDLGFEPFYRAGRPNDTNNLQPRLGFAYQVNPRTVLRGGWGVYFADALTIDAFWPKYNTQLARIQINNDGRPDFGANPLNGQPLPTYAQAQSLFCHSPAQAANFAAWQARNFSGAAPCLLLSIQEMVAPDEYMQMARNIQTSIGAQRQFGDSISLEVDYIYGTGTHEKDTIDNINLTFDPATGTNYPYAATGADRARLPYPQYGIMSMIPHNTRSRLSSLQTAVTRRMAHHWQASATYTLSWFWDQDNQAFSGLNIVPFEVTSDLGGPASFGLGASDQRHRAVFNGIWEVGHGLQVSGLHYFGAGIRSGTNYGGDLRGVGTGGSARLRPDGTLVPRNGFIQPAQNRSDVRFQQKLTLRRTSIDLIAEAFNLFNRTNYTLDTSESSVATYERPATGQYRTVQLGFRITY